MIVNIVFKIQTKLFMYSRGYKKSPHNNSSTNYHRINLLISNYWKYSLLKADEYKICLQGHLRIKTSPNIVYFQQQCPIPEAQINSTPLNQLKTKISCISYDECPIT